MNTTNKQLMSILRFDVHYYDALEKSSFFDVPAAEQALKDFNAELKTNPDFKKTAEEFASMLGEDFDDYFFGEKDDWRRALCQKAFLMAYDQVKSKKMKGHRTRAPSKHAPAVRVDVRKMF